LKQPTRAIEKTAATNIEAIRGMGDLEKTLAEDGFDRPDENMNFRRWHEIARGNLLGLVAQQKRC
jgi:hypothetical protein